MARLLRGDSHPDVTEPLHGSPRRFADLVETCERCVTRDFGFTDAMTVAVAEYLASTPC